VNIKVAGWHDLEERLPVEVDLVESGVFLVIDVGIGEAALGLSYPFEMMSPLDCSCRYLLRFTP
jgi:hypothetical protein